MAISGRVLLPTGGVDLKPPARGVGADSISVGQGQTDRLRVGPPDPVTRPTLAGDRELRDSGGRDGPRPGIKPRDQE